MIWRAGKYEFRFPRPVLVMGILNVTPDSFSDGGKYLEKSAAVDRALELASEGADILDIGGESTRPRSEPVPAGVELGRVVPVLEGLAGRVTIPLSIDTQKAEVARAAVAGGVSIINDVGASRAEAAMWECAAESGAGYVVMHMQGTPQTMQSAPRYEDVVTEIESFFCERRKRLAAAGVREEQIVFDPGIGFGKSLRHNLELLSSLGRFTKLERPLLLGVSRKSFMGKLIPTDVGDRLAAGLACAVWAAMAGAHLIRTHDVRETRQALRMLEAIVEHRTRRTDD